MLGASPQLEWWNVGKLGLGMLQYWINGKNLSELILRIDKCLQKPLFHHSIFPWNLITAILLVADSTGLNNQDFGVRIKYPKDPVDPV
jgi:hypothetical protein